jgi:PadR family transcriptional regulator PadR
MADVLGAFEQAVLLAVVRLRGDAYGRAIFSDVQSRLERDVAAGAVHATLRRLEDKGLLVTSDEAGDAVRAGRPRRYYRLTPAGRGALNDTRSAVDNLWRGLRYPLKGNI